MSKYSGKSGLEIKWEKELEAHKLGEFKYGLPNPRWTGNIQAQKESDLAYSKLKPKQAKSKPPKSRKKKKRKHRNRKQTPAEYEAALKRAMSITGTPGEKCPF